ncbi:MAG: tetratricopeptide repeat protein [Candidatus Ozemobacteraceae bacterium]
MNSRTILLLLLCFVLTAFPFTLSAQPGPEGPDGGPEVGPGGQRMGPGGPGMGPGGPGMRGKGPKDPAEMAKRQKMGALRSTAEAHKNLSEMYKDAGKIDEAVAELKKILALSSAIDLKEEPQMANQIGNVYLGIAECYLSKDRVAEAEATINEGYEKIKTLAPEIASRMCLFLGNVYKKSGKTAEAEKYFKRVIELNQTAISGTPAAGK